MDSMALDSTGREANRASVPTVPETLHTSQVRESIEISGEHSHSTQVIDNSRNKGQAQTIPEAPNTEEQNTERHAGEEITSPPAIEGADINEEAVNKENHGIKSPLTGNFDSMGNIPRESPLGEERK